MGPIWIQLDRFHPETHQWLLEESGLRPSICEALLAEETRPRCQHLDEGLLLILRGVNLNPGADPEDMVSVRMWIDPNRIITLRGPNVLALKDIEEKIAKGRGPESPGDFLVEISRRLIERMGPVLGDIDDEFDDIEEALLESHDASLRHRVSPLRRQVVVLRRYLSPQRDVMVRISLEKTPWLKEAHLGHLHETADRVTRYVEDLDALRERALVLHDELTSRSSEEINKKMFVLAIITVIFMPLGLITGLLGINVGGIPGSQNQYAFFIVCFLLLALAMVQFVLLWYKKWF
jgi:zinc transporter